MATVKQIIEAAMRRLGVLAQGEALDAAQVQDGLAALRDLLDAWSLKGIYIPFRTVESFDLSTIGFQGSYTWGSGGDFASTPPEEIWHAYFSDGGGNDWPLEQWDSGTWAAQRFKGHVARPIGYWYEPGEPLGTVRFETIPFDPTVTFITAKPLANTQALTAELDLPRGFDRLAKWCLAEELAPEYEVEIVPGSTLWRNMRDAKRTVANRYARAPVARFEAGLRSGYRDYSIESGPVGY